MDSTLPDKLRRIGSEHLESHPYLTPTVCCYYFAEYHPRESAATRPVNQLIHNYKRDPHAIDRHPRSAELRYYKQRALEDIANALKRCIPRQAVDRDLTFVPIPPSRIRADPNYCDRLERTLRRAFSHCRTPDIRPLLHQTRTTASDHRSRDRRLRYDELLAVTQINVRELDAPFRQRIVVFDDVLCTGKHFKVAATRLREVAPHQAIVGLFVARCVRAVG